MDHEQMRAWRKRMKLTQQEAAELLCVSKSTITAYETPPKQKQKARRVPDRMVKLIKSLSKIDRLQGARA